MTDSKETKWKPVDDVIDVHITLPPFPLPPSHIHATVEFRSSRYERYLDALNTFRKLYKEDKNGP